MFSGFINVLPEVCFSKYILSEHLAVSIRELCVAEWATDQEHRC